MFLILSNLTGLSFHELVPKQDTSDSESESDYEKSGEPSTASPAGKKGSKGPAAAETDTPSRLSSIEVGSSSGSEGEEEKKAKPKKKRRRLNSRGSDSGKNGQHTAAETKQKSVETKSDGAKQGMYVRIKNYLVQASQRT